MNRLAPTQSHRVVGIAAGLWLLLVMDGFAQMSMPPGTPTSLPEADSTAAAPSPAAGQIMIGQVKRALQQKDFKAAIGNYRHAAAIVANTPQLAPELNALKQQLVKAGVDAALLAPAPPKPKLLPMVQGGSAPPQMSDRKREALRLIALGRVALDRGDIRDAVAKAHQAQALQVPETAFAPGEPRVWEFVLDAESAARRSGIAVPSASSQPPGAVQPAVAMASPQSPSDIQQSVFNEANGNAAGGQQPIQQVQNQTSAGDAGTDGPGERLFREGMKALSAGNKDLARKKFVEAWTFEDQLEIGLRAQLQDKLTLLQPSRLPITGTTQDSNAPLTPIERAEMESQMQTQRLYREIQAELSQAEEIKESKPLEAVSNLEGLLRRIDGSDVDTAAKQQMSAMVKRALVSQQSYVEANKATIEQDLRNQAIETEMAVESARNSRIDQEVTSLVEEFNNLIEQRRYPEAEVVAKQVAELKPDEAIAQSLFHQSRMKTRLLRNQEVRDSLENSFFENLMAVEEAAIGLRNPDIPVQFADARSWADLSERRLSREGDNGGLSIREKVIQEKLTTEDVEVNYRDRPLSQVIQELAAMADINIVLDNRALSAARIESDEPITLELNNRVLLKSALSLILEPLDASFVIQNDALVITSREAKRSNVRTQTYRVADLVTPIPNFTSSYDDGLAGALRAAYQMASPQANVQVMPVSATDLGSGMARAMSPASVGPNQLGNSALGQYHAMGGGNSFGPSPSPMSGQGGAAFADFDSLMQLIQTTVVPDTWEALGGPSTMFPYQQNLSLVISTTSDVHDQIADLLESLRRLQNLQITIEVRFITLSDSFFEQIGIDFDVQLDDNINVFPQDDSGPSVTFGLDADGLPRTDLDIRLNNESFGLTPPFVAPGNVSTLGFAILSDIEAFFFLQASQGDSRTNVMQAPKVTLFDGQIATISDVTQQPFVISITPVVGDFAVAQQPVVVVLNEGTQLSVQGVVSEDKRFVRLTLVPFFSQIGDVDTFTFEGSRTTNRSSRDEDGDTNGDGVVDDDDTVDEEEEEEVVQGTTVQLPTFSFTSVSTTVSVPDGGTILLGGIKRLSEGREERGIPVLSKIPYVSRLFRNVSAGRQATSLMLMVTPRIIIQEEEEIAQTGFEPPR